MKGCVNQGARDGFQTWQVAQEYIPGKLIDEFRRYFRAFDPKGSGVIKTEVRTDWQPLRFGIFVAQQSSRSEMSDSIL